MMGVVSAWKGSEREIFETEEETRGRKTEAGGP
jgi:hypothetical protein